jgi:hypothetical protein
MCVCAQPYVYDGGTCTRHNRPNESSPRIITIITIVTIITTSIIIIATSIIIISIIIIR